jgi:uncharacterized Ntn-hydrolase superfamily protein
MTISILAFDEEASCYGGAAATGSLCVGGWVLRGDPESGLSASQGSLPSTIWGSEVLGRMKDGAPASTAVLDVTGRDAGRDQRQLSALDPAGGTAGFTGKESIPAAGIRHARHVIVAGNMLASEKVLEAALEGFLDAKGDLDERLFQALAAAAAAGGDSRGFMSAALLVVSRESAPLTLRIDYAEDPLAELRALHRRATTGAYARWATHVPTLANPERSEPFLDRVE